MSNTIRTTGFKGDQGDTGTPGTVIFSATGAPTTVADSIINDIYLDTDSDKLYRQTSIGTWVELTDLTGTTGATGTAGTRTFDGTGVPTTIVDSLVNDLYIDTNTGKIYRQTATDVWTEIADFTGEKGDTGETGSSVAGLFAEQSTVVPAVSYPYHLILAGDTAFTTYTTTTTTDGRGLIKFYGGDTVSGDGVSSGGSSALGTDAAATVVMSRTDRDGNTVIAVGQEQAFIDADNTFVVNNNSVDTTVTLNTFVVDGGDYTVAPFNAYVMFRVGWVSGSSVNILDADVTLDFSPEVTTTLPSPATYAAGAFTRYSNALYFTYGGVTVTAVDGDYPDNDTTNWSAVTLT